MMCSARELGLTDAHDGIIELPDSAAAGTALTEVLSLDPLFEIAVTPNRADCLGVRGIARDLGAAGLGRLKPLDLTPVPGSFASPIGVRLEDCASPLFAGRLISGVRNGDSPAWLKERLGSIGLKPISALVDITNFFTFDLNRPLHVFDASALSGDLVVRRAQAGETLLALNGKTLDLAPDMTVIADAAGPQSIGGVMGGAATGVRSDTSVLFLEAALFDPAAIAATGRRLGLDSDARHRFERGVDPDFVLPGLELATRMILDLCGGEASALVVAGEVPPPRAAVPFRPERVARLGGVAPAPREMQAMLEGLGCKVDSGAQPWQVGLPSWRVDLTAEHDLVEEVLRLFGYDQVPAVSLSRPAVARPILTPAQRRLTWLRRALAARGLFETVTWSFLAAEQATLFGGGQAELRLVNPISSDLDCMRPSLLPNLLAAAARNSDRGSKDIALFEIGPQFKGTAPQDQQAMAAGLRAGSSGARHWAVPARACDLFDAKADMLAALISAGAPVDRLQIGTETPSWYHPGRSGCLSLGNRPLAWFGEIHPGLLDAFDLALPAAAFEIALDALPPLKIKSGRARPPFRPPPLQAILRDFAFVVDRTVSADIVLRAARNADKTLITSVTLFDVYEGPSLGEGKKSLAIEVTLQPVDRTPTDAEIEVVAGRVRQAVVAATGGQLRD